MSDAPIRVLVVDDTAVYRKIISDALTGLPGITVVGTAHNGRAALRKIEEFQPDMLTLDLAMPEMDGLELLRHLKATGSRLATIVLSSPASDGTDTALAALSLGAIDFVVKPAGGSIEENAAKLQKELVRLIQGYARTRHIRSILLGGNASPAPTAMPAVKRLAASVTSRANDTIQRLRTMASTAAGRPQIVAIGVSTGGPQALTAMMPRLPANLGVPVVIVQHMPPLFTKSLAESLNQKCALEVCEATEGQTITAGGAYIAPGGKQMKIRRENGLNVLRITDDPPENSCRPSVDYLFRSVAGVYGGNAVGVIMTGMGNDGTVGCRLLHEQGAAIIAQDEASCVVYGMPRQPAEEGLAEVIAPLDRIAEEIVRLVREGAAVCK